MPTRFLVDTDVLIDYLRGKNEAIDFIAAHEDEISISAITAAELYAGVREGKEKQILDNLIHSLSIFNITPQIAKIGGLFRRDFGKSHGVGLVDALIAATVQTESLELVTLNRKHFPMFSKITTPYN